MTGRRRLTAVLDLGFGDAGKGTTVDWLAASAAHPLIVRHHGGGQAGHRVVTPDGRAHVFAQFGAGLFHPDARSLLGPEMIVHPLAWRVELDHLDAAGVPCPARRSFVHADCRLTTPMLEALGRLREVARGSSRHGTCGMGVGETVAASLRGHVLRVRDVGGLADLRRWFRAHHQAIRDEARPLWQRVEAREPEPSHGGRTRERVARDAWTDLSDPAWADECALAFRDWRDRVQVVDEADAHRMAIASDHVVFEGAQGVLLDETHGLRPHTTWSDCTDLSARRAAAALGLDAADLRILGVTRTYATRHGEGPFPSECPTLTARWRDAANGDGPWQGVFRIGALDEVLLRTARAALHQLDAVMVTHCDTFETWDDPRIVRAWTLAPDERRVTKLPAANAAAAWHDPDERTGVAHGARVEHERPLSLGKLLGYIADATDAPCAVLSWGATRADKEVTASPFSAR